jgi:hypothetical protein
VDHGEGENWLTQILHHTFLSTRSIVSRLASTFLVISYPKEVNRNVYILFSLWFTFSSYIWYQFCGIRSCRAILKHGHPVHLQFFSFHTIFVCRYCFQICFLVHFLQGPDVNLIFPIFPIWFGFNTTFSGEMY